MFSIQVSKDLSVFFLEIANSLYRTLFSIHVSKDLSGDSKFPVLYNVVHTRNSHIIKESVFQVIANSLYCTTLSAQGMGVVSAPAA